jgi:hypothetical protein
MLRDEKERDEIIIDLSEIIYFIPLYAYSVTV